MKKLFLLLLILFLSSSSYSKPKIDFQTLMIKSELNPVFVKNARIEAGTRNLPVYIYISNTALIEARDIENGNVVYSVITNFPHPEIGGYTAFYEDVIAEYDLSRARIRYADGRVIDNSGEIITLSKRALTKVLMIPDWSFDRVMSFDYYTGDLVDTAFVHSNGPNLQSPKQSLQKSKSRIFVSDQLSDVVQEYDTLGLFVRTYAPSTGVNNAILDNIRGIAFRPNGNLLVCNAGTTGNSQNTVQQFDTGGVFLNTFMSASVNSPFSLLYRQSDILLGNSSGTPKIFKYDFNGNLIGPFTNTTLNFVQQLWKNPDGTIVACEFSGTGSGLKVFDSTGTLITTLNGVTGVRGVFRLPTGNYLTTNSAGLYEIDDTTGALVRQIYATSNLQYIDLYDPAFVTSVENNNEIPLRYNLYNNYPNPFNPVTTIKYEIPEKSQVSIKVFDNLGREVAELFSGIRTAGVYEIGFDGTGLSSGIYHCILRSGNFTKSIKMILMK